MEERDLSAIRQWLGQSSAAQMVFENEELLALSSRAKEFLPEVQIGDPAEKIFGDKTELFRSFDGKGSVLFTIHGIDGLLNVNVTGWMGCTMVEIISDLTAASISAMRTISYGLTEPMATLMSLSPKLLTQLSENDDTMQKAALFNRSLYVLMRETKNIQAATGQVALTEGKKSINVPVWLEEFGEKLKPLCEMSGRRFSLMVPAKAVMCFLDPERMERALLNLISNAIKFTEPEGQITLRMNKLPSGRIRITVEDDGCGIPADQMATIFQRSEHRKPIPDPREGSGLGLLLARNIVMGNGGTLMLDSRQGEGTRVHITLDAGNCSGPLVLRSDVATPVVSGGYDPMLVELSQVLPWEAYDTRGVDL